MSLRQKGPPVSPTPPPSSVCRGPDHDSQPRGELWELAKPGNSLITLHRAVSTGMEITQTHRARSSDNCRMRSFQWGLRGKLLRTDFFFFQSLAEYYGLGKKQRPLITTVRVGKAHFCVPDTDRQEGWLHRAPLTCGKSRTVPAQPEVGIHSSICTSEHEISWWNNHYFLVNLPNLKAGYISGMTG